MKRPLSYWCLLCLLPLLWLGQATAVPVGAPLEFDSPEQAALYQEVIRELRCTVCQNQSLVDSNASLARDLRRNTYEMVQQGAQRDEIIGFMVNRYGDFVLYRTPLRWYTVLLWFGPFLLLIIGVAILVVVIRGRHAQARMPQRELTDDERKRLQQLLRKHGDSASGEK